MFAYAATLVLPTIFLFLLFPSSSSPLLNSSLSFVSVDFVIMFILNPTMQDGSHLCSKLLHKRGAMGVPTSGVWSSKSQSRKWPEQLGSE